MLSIEMENLVWKENHSYRSFINTIKEEDNRNCLTKNQKFYTYSTTFLSYSEGVTKQLTEEVNLIDSSWSD